MTDYLNDIKEKGITTIGWHKNLVKEVLNSVLDILWCYILTLLWYAWECHENGYQTTMVMTYPIFVRLGETKSYRTQCNNIWLPGSTGITDDLYYKITVFFLCETWCDSIALFWKAMKLLFGARNGI